MRADHLSDSSILAHYRELVDEDGESWLPMLRLVENLCVKDYAHFLPASASHDALVIGDVNDGISVVGDDRTFWIQFWEDGRRRVEKHKREYFEVEKLVDALALRLSHKPQFS